MFIKPFLNSRDKKIISVVIPLQVFANIASAIGNETAIGSSDWPFWVGDLITMVEKGFLMITKLEHAVVTTH